MYNFTPKRNLNLHEHISLGLLASAGVKTPRFGVAKTPDEALQAAEKIGTIYFHDYLRSIKIAFKCTVNFCN